MMSRARFIRRSSLALAAGLLALAGSSAAIGRPGAGTPQAQAGFADRLLRAHNAERAPIGAPPLAWDASLAAASSS